MTEHRTWIMKFLWPTLDWKFVLRVAILAVTATAFFTYLCIPATVNGDSMLPHYQTGDFLFCWTPTFAIRKPRQGDVVMIAYAGTKVMLLKRIIATEGQEVQFRNGQLFLDGNPVQEPWTNADACDWNTEPVTVRTNCVYVVGDNRTTPIRQHLHGEVDLKDLVGTPWPKAP